MLSSPGGRLEYSYDVVVVGSGYGGAIAASRFARAGRSVCLLERGLERHPGDFPETLRGGAREMQITTRKRRIGKATALFDLRLDDEANVLVGCGLGGTSLINANVALRPAPRVFDDPRWPTPLRSPGALDPWFERAETWLGSTRYPTHGADLPKLTTLGDLAGPLGGTLQRAPINVTFATDTGANAGPNPAGIVQPPCNGCGNCIAGCNVGAKNTVLMNYLPDAVRHGARLFTGCAVRTVLPVDGAPESERWEVEFDLVGSGRRRFRPSGRPTVRAGLVVLSAGTLGSTEILLRSGDAGLELSDHLGERFSGNGDVLGFAYGSDRDVRGIGWTRRQLKAGDHEPVGPCITGVVSVEPAAGESGSSRVVEEGSVPGVLSRLMPITLLACVLFGSNAGILGRIRMVCSSWKARANRTFVYLVMGNDSADGRLELDDDHLVVDWRGAVTDRDIAETNELLDRVSAEIGAEYGPQPLWNRTAGHEVVTVHPLGGCVMADDAEHGVVDHRGEVFAGSGGTATHAGLHVLDGSILPRPIETNPSLTISALTERAVDLITAERGWTIDTAPAGEHRTFFEEVAWAERERDARGSAVGVRFTERMSGPDLSFVLTITVDDLAQLERDPGRAQRCIGTVDAPGLSSAPLQVTNGEFRLLERQPDRAEEWAMVYRMDLHAQDGRTFHFEGRKHIRTGSLLRGWRDTTTLHVTVSEHEEVVWSGVLRISIPDLLRQVLTIHTTRQAGLRLMSGVRTKYRFLRIFKGALLPIYGGPLAGEQAPDHQALLRSPRLPPPSIAWYSPDSGWHDLEGRALDEARQHSVPGSVLNGVGPDAQLLLTHYPATDPTASKGPVVVAAGFSMRANSLAVPTTDQSLVEALHGDGFDVWLFDYRSSIALPSSHHDHTLDDIARVDWPEGIAEVRRRTGADDVQVVGHCVGSISILMAILAGAQGVRSAVCSQFALHPRTSFLNRAKNALRIVDLVDFVGIEGLAPDGSRSMRSRLASRAVELLPVPAGEQCTQPVCRWLNGVFGLTHAHAQLDAATHDSFATAFGNGDVTALQHLGRITRARRAVDSDGGDTYLPHVDRLHLPLLFVQGTENYIFKPEGTDATLTWLRDHHPDSEQLHELLTLDGYAHLDGLVGRRAHVDVFPQILDFLNRTA